MKSTSTIRDVAKLANTSTAAVSYVLNGKKGMVGAAVSERIHQAAEQLGYRPARQARQMRGQVNKTIGVQVDSSIVQSNSWRSGFMLNLVMIQGINEYAGLNGYHVHLIAPSADNDIEALQSQVLSENSIDGAIFLGYRDKTFTPQLEKAIGRMHSLGLPAVTISERLAEKGMPIVSIDLKPAVEESVQRLKSLQVRKAAYIGTTNTLEHEQRGRFELFSDALKKSGITLSDNHIYETSLEIGGYQGVLAFLKQGELPGCVIFGSDHQAMAGMAALADNGISVPGDIRVLGVDHAPYAAQTPIELASLDQRYFDRGQLLAKTLLEQIKEPNEKIACLPSAARTVLDARFVDGASLSGNTQSKIVLNPPQNKNDDVGQVLTCQKISN